MFVGSGVLVHANYKLIATANEHPDARWSGPMYPATPATGNASLSCSQQAPCLFDVVSDVREEHDLASAEPDLVASMQSRLATLMKGVFEAEPVSNASQAKVCTASVANGMWITPFDWPSLPPTPAPAPKCKPPSPAPHPTPLTPLPMDEWLAYAGQWKLDGSSITATKTCAVLKKECSHSNLLPANETRFFDADHVLQLGAPPKPTAMCGADLPYFKVNVHLPELK